ncbi:hypothetical protein ACLPAF_02655, partial [Proteus mirabilis]
VKSIDTANRRLYLQPTYGNTSLFVGLRFKSQFSPTPPRMFNQDGSYMEVDKLIIQFYTLTLRYTSPFTITASDRGGSIYDASVTSAIRYTSEGLGLVTAPLAERSHLKVRVGMEVESSSILFESDTAGDFNLQSLGYLVKFYNKVRRV